MRNNIILFMMLLFSFALLISGCRSEVPKPTSYQFSTQQKMQAAHHWDVLAEDVANQICLKLNKLESKYGHRSLYVVKNRSGAFTNAFYELLISNLLKKGIDISTEKSNSINVKYKTQVIHHQAERSQRSWPGYFTATASVISGGVAVARNVSEGSSGGAAAIGGILTGAALDSLQGYHVNLSNNEVLITTSVIYDNRILFNYTDIYYINDVDKLIYKDAVKVETKTYYLKSND